MLQYDYGKITIIVDFSAQGQQHTKETNLRNNIAHRRISEREGLYLLFLMKKIKSISFFPTQGILLLQNVFFF